MFKMFSLIAALNVFITIFIIIRFELTCIQDVNTFVESLWRIDSRETIGFLFVRYKQLKFALDKTRREYNGVAV